MKSSQHTYTTKLSTSLNRSRFGLSLGTGGALGPVAFAVRDQGFRGASGLSLCLLAASFVALGLICVVRLLGSLSLPVCFIGLLVVLKVWLVGLVRLVCWLGFVYLPCWFDLLGWFCLVLVCLLCWFRLASFRFMFLFSLACCVGVFGLLGWLGVLLFFLCRSFWFIDLICFTCFRCFLGSLEKPSRPGWGVGDAV